MGAAVRGREGARTGVERTRRRRAGTETSAGREPYGFACSGDQSADRCSGDGRIARCELTGCGGRRGAAHEGNRGGTAGHILVCDDGPAGGIAERSGLSSRGRQSSGYSRGRGQSRGASGRAPATKATVDIDVDANIIKARQASLAFQVPVRTDGVQVQATQGGQQASIALAAPVLMADAGEAGTVADQIVKAIKIQVRDGIGEVRLRLQPEQMGEVHIALKVDRDRVSAVLQVERPELRAQIEGQGQTLRAGLAAQGLQLEDLTVRPMLSDDPQGREGDQRGSAKDTPQRRRRQSTTKQFELDDQ